MLRHQTLESEVANGRFGAFQFAETGWADRPLRGKLDSQNERGRDRGAGNLNGAYQPSRVIAFAAPMAADGRELIADASTKQPLSTN